MSAGVFCDDEVIDVSSRRFGHWETAYVVVVTDEPRTFTYVSYAPHSRRLTCWLHEDVACHCCEVVSAFRKAEQASSAPRFTPDRPPNVGHWCD